MAVLIEEIFLLYLAVLDIIAVLLDPTKLILEVWRRFCVFRKAFKADATVVGTVI
jgi:hypothetical protein